MSCASFWRPASLATCTQQFLTCVKHFVPEEFAVPESCNKRRHDEWLESHRVGLCFLAFSTYSRSLWQLAVGRSVTWKRHRGHMLKLVRSLSWTIFWIEGSFLEILSVSGTRSPHQSLPVLEVQCRHVGKSSRHPDTRLSEIKKVLLLRARRGRGSEPFPL